MENYLRFESSRNAIQEYLASEVNRILDLLTSQSLKFRLDMGMAVKRIKRLPIDNFGKMHTLANTIFDKAINVSNSKVIKACALLSRELSTVDKQFKTEVFRNIFVLRCQMEFESLMSIDKSIRNGMLQTIEHCTDPSIKAEVATKLGHYDKNLRWRSIRCIRFLGELYKHEILTVPIMKICLNKLLDRKDDPSLDSFCELVRMVGRDVICYRFETNDDVRRFFMRVHEIAYDEHVKIGDDVRLMLKATIIEMSKWSRMSAILCMST